MKTSPTVIISFAVATCNTTSSELSPFKMQRMAERRLPKIALNWIPKQTRARGRPKKKWIEEIKKET